MDNHGCEKLNGLSTRLKNCLANADIYTWEQLCNQKSRDIKKLKNFGKKCLMELESAVAAKGLHFKGEGPLQCPHCKQYFDRDAT